MTAVVSRPDCDRWCDIDGTPLAQFCRVEQVEEAPEPGLLSSRLGQQGEVVGRVWSHCSCVSPIMRCSACRRRCYACSPTRRRVSTDVHASAHRRPDEQLRRCLGSADVITLSRVADGNVTQQGDHYLDGGAPLPPYLIVPSRRCLPRGCWPWPILIRPGGNKSPSPRRDRAGMSNFAAVGPVGWTSRDSG